MPFVRAHCHAQLWLCQRKCLFKQLLGAGAGTHRRMWRHTRRANKHRYTAVPSTALTLRWARGQAGMFLRSMVPRAGSRALADLPPVTVEESLPLTCGRSDSWQSTSRQLTGCPELCSEGRRVRLPQAVRAGGTRQAAGPAQRQPQAGRSWRPAGCILHRMRLLQTLPAAAGGQRTCPARAGVCSRTAEGTHLFQ